MKLIIALLATAMFLTACEFSQDPLAGSSDAVRAGKPAEDNQKIEPAKAIPSDFLKIDATQDTNGRVGSPLEIKILGRVLVPDVDSRIEIENIADYPNAKYDTTTGIFSWTPTKSHDGRSSIGRSSCGHRFSYGCDAYIHRHARAKRVWMKISNDYVKPIINSISGTTSGLIGGKRYTYDFALEDVDARDKTECHFNCRKLHKKLHQLGRSLYLKL